MGRNPGRAAREIALRGLDKKGTIYDQKINTLDATNDINGLMEKWQPIATLVAHMTSMAICMTALATYMATLVTLKIMLEAFAGGFSY